jgi:hypothetical protein
MPEPDEDAPATPAQIAEFIHWKLFDQLSQVLDKEKKDILALRKALLLLIVMTAEGASKPVRTYIDYLLTHFQPLAGQFTKEQTHDFLPGHWVARAREHASEHLLLVLPKDLIDKLLEEDEDE